MSANNDVTLLIRRAADGDDAALGEVAKWAYDHLERLASAEMRKAFGRDLAGVTLEPAALVNETFLKLLGTSFDFANRRHFYSFASTVLKRVLLDYHRRRAADKRGGDAIKLTLSGVGDRTGTPSMAGATDLVRTLAELEELDPRKAEVVTLKVLWGLETSEIAATLDVSVSTVERDWRFARTWLADRLERGQ